MMRYDQYPSRTRNGAEERHKWLQGIAAESLIKVLQSPLKSQRKEGLTFNDRNMNPQSLTS